MTSPPNLAISSSRPGSRYRLGLDVNPIGVDKSLQLVSLVFYSLQESDVFYIPTSGLSGENLATRSSVSELTSWYSGPSLLEQIGKLSITGLLLKCQG